MLRFPAFCNVLHQWFVGFVSFVVPFSGQGFSNYRTRILFSCGKLPWRSWKPLGAFFNKAQKKILNRLFQD